jgi:APA family basic amino acid/polyamine antiporter
MENANGTLKRQLGLRTATLLVIGEVIAVGIFLTPAGMAKAVGSPMWLLVVWLVMGGMALCGALCYAELAVRFPATGGGYVYLREAYGPKLAFLYGWMCLLVMDPGITAALAVGIAGYVGYNLNLSSLALKLIAVAVILLLAAVNILGVRLGAWMMRWLTFLKLGLLFLILIWGFGFQLGNWSNFVPFDAQRVNSEPLVAALAGAFIAAFFSFGGWWDVNKLAGEVRDPERNLPRALIGGVLVVTLVYILTSAVFMYLVPVERVTSGETFAAQAGEALFGRAGGQVFAVVVIVSVLGSLASIIMAAPRVYFAMARDELFFPFAAQVHPKLGTPARAIALQAGLACLLVALGTFNQIVSYFIFVVVLFIALTVVGLFVIRRRKNGTAAAYSTLGYPATPLIFLGFVLVLLAMLLMHDPKRSLLGLLVVALGIPVYYLVFGRKATRHGQKTL